MLFFPDCPKSSPLTHRLAGRMSKSDIIYYGIPKNSQRVIKTTSAKSHPVHQSGKRAARPTHLAHNGHAEALVERACHGIFFSDREVKVAARGLDDLLD